MKRSVLPAAILIVALLGYFAPAAAGADLAVALQPMPPSHVTTVRNLLDSARYTLGTVRWSGPRYNVYIAEAQPTGTWNDALAAMAALDSVSELVHIGELLSHDTTHYSVTSGRVAVEFTTRLTVLEAAAWGASHDLLDPIIVPHNNRTYTFHAPLSSQQMLALQLLAGTDPVIDLSPIIVELGGGRHSRQVGGGFHYVPQARNVLGVFLKPGTDWTREQADAQFASAINLKQWSNPFWLLQFPDETQLMEVQKLFAQSQDIIHSGAAISINPPAVLDNEIVVKFKNPTGPWEISPTAISRSLTQGRALPYVANGFVYFSPEYGYGIYDAVTALMQSGLVHYAVPNLYFPSWDESCDDCLGDASSAYTEYLTKMEMCDAWDLITGAAQPVTVGMLDRGVKSSGVDSSICTELAISYLGDLNTLTSCPATPADTWCTTCEQVALEGTSHGAGVGYIIGAEHANGTLFGIAADAKLVSVKRWSIDDSDDNADSLNATTMLHLADSLIWLAGGDPNWNCTTGTYTCSTDAPMAPLTGDLPADIINLSFSIEDFLEGDCDAAAPEEDCILLCDGFDTCNPIQDALRVLRNPDLFGETIFEQSEVRGDGVVVVAAVGLHGLAPDGDEADAYRSSTTDPAVDGWEPHVDLAASTDTIAVGSTNPDGKPYEDSLSQYHWIQWPGKFINVVAPLGKDTTHLYDNGPQFGASSAATAAVSGIAALMLQANSNLSAAQVECILETTANQSLTDPEDTWDVPGCEFTDGYNGFESTNRYSVCVGYGMVDAGAAVLAAQACGEPGLQLACLGPISEYVDAELLDEMTNLDLLDSSDDAETDESMAPFTGERVLVEGGVEHVLTFPEAIQSGCPCSATGDKIAAPPDVAPFHISDQVFRQPLALRINEDVIRILECVSNGKCVCSTPNCINFDLINEHEHIWHDVVFKACIADRCWDLPARFPEWKPGQEYTVPMVIDRMIPAMWRATGELPILKAFSRGEEILPPSPRPSCGVVDRHGPEDGREGPAEHR